MSLARGHYDVRLSAKQENDKISELVRELGTAKPDNRLSKVMLAHDLIAKWSRDIRSSNWKSKDLDWFTMLNGVCEGIAEALKAQD